METIDEESGEEFVIADFSQVPETRSILDEPSRVNKRKGKKNFLGNNLTEDLNTMKPSEYLTKKQL